MATVHVRENITISCESPWQHPIWYFNGNILPHNVHLSETDQKIMIHEIRLLNFGIYSCIGTMENNKHFIASSKLVVFGE